MSSGRSACFHSAWDLLKSELQEHSGKVSFASRTLWAETRRHPPSDCLLSAAARPGVERGAVRRTGIGSEDLCTFEPVLERQYEFRQA
jgi:hypothetical protein